MLKLDQTTRKLQAVLSGAVTTNQLPCMVSYSDDNGTTYVGGTQLTNTNSTTAVDICAAPGASTVRDIDYLSIRNRDTAAATVTVLLDDNGTDYEIVKAALAVGDQLTYTHGDGWRVIDADGNLKTGGSSGTGDVVGPASATANSLARFDGTTGKLLKDGAVIGTDVQAYDVDTSNGLFVKADMSVVAFSKTGAGAAEIKAGTKVYVSGTIVKYASATSITMPTLTAGTDYAIWVKDDGTIQADASFTSAPGAGSWRKIGGFHYAPGGNATGVAGGDTTAAINAYSFWDLKFKPACPDPRGMTLVADSFWADIYLLGVDHLTNGTSKYNVSIADGSAPPKIPTKFGGNGSTAYSTLNWWEAAEVMQSWGKRLPTYDEFAALAYGTTEAQASGGTDVPTTGVNGTGYANTWNEFTSKWGVIQATGCMWVWGGELGGPYGSSAWTANTGGRGSTYNLSNAVLFGGYWGTAADAGSRASYWSDAPAASSGGVGARGVCDHLTID